MILWTSPCVLPEEDKTNKKRNLPFHLPEFYPRILAMAEHLGRSGPLSACSRPPSFLPGCQDFLKMNVGNAESQGLPLSLDANNDS